MIAAEYPVHEPGRLAALERYAILDTAEESAFDALTQAAAAICKTPIALISLVDAERQWFKSALGLPAGVRETPREVAFCAHAILGREIFEVPDASTDQRFHDNPLVTHDPAIRFYAGMPLIDSDGYGLGTLCVIDQVTRRLEPHQRQALQSIAEAIMALLEARLLRAEIVRLQERTLDEIDAARHTLRFAAWRDAAARDQVQAISLPSQHFSGDIVAAAYTPDGALRGLLADAVGHGLAAAFNVLPVLDSFYSMTEKGIDIGKVATEINRKLHRLLPIGNFVAFALAEIDEHRIQVWNGGLPDLLQLACDGSVCHRFPSRHCAGGILPPDAFRDALDTHPFTRSDELLMFSDGLSEANDPSGQMFSMDRIAGGVAGIAPGGRASQLHDLVLKHIGDGEPHDDISVLVLPRPAAPGPGTVGRPSA